MNDGPEYRPDPDAWTLAGYQEAQADIRWSKERASNIVYWSILLIAGTAAASRGPTALPESVYVIAVGCLLLLAALWLIQLHSFARKLRNHVDKLMARVPDPYPDPSARPKDKHHVGLLGSQLAVLVGAAALAISTICG